MRGLRIALLVSVALNLALLGVIGSHQYRVMRERDAERDRRVERAAGPLSPEGRQIVRENFRANREEVAPLVGEMRRTLREFEEAVLAEPFDRARADRALAAVRAASNAVRDRQLLALLEVAPKLNAEDRARVLQNALRRDVPPPGRDGGPGRDRQPGPPR